MSTSTIPGVAGLHRQHCHYIRQRWILQVACGLFGQILVVAVARLEQRLAPHVVLARGAVKNVGPDQRDSFARQEHVQVHHLDRADDLPLRLGLDGQTTHGERIVHCFPFQLSQVGIARRCGRSRQEEQQTQAGAAHERRLYARNQRRRSHHVRHNALSRLPPGGRCVALSHGKGDNQGSSGQHSAAAGRKTGASKKQPDIGYNSGGITR